MLCSDFPNLQRLKFSKPRAQQNENVDLIEFVERHGRLKRILLRGQQVNDDIAFMNAVGQNCNALEELELLDLQHVYIYYFALRKLARLRFLHLEFREGSVPYFNRNVVMDPKILDFNMVFRSLSTMRVSFQNKSANKVPREMCDLLVIPWRNLTRLTKVYVNGEFVASLDSSLIEIITHLTKLEKLHFEGSWNTAHYRDDWLLAKEEFDLVVEIVKRRKHLLILTCNFGFPHSDREEDKVKLIKLTR